MSVIDQWGMLIGIFAGVLIAAIVFIAAALVPTLNQVKRTAQAYEEIAIQLKGQIDPTLHEAQGLVRDVSSLTRRVDGDLKVVSRIVEDVSDTTAYAKDLANTVKTEIERPLLGLVSTIAGFRRGAEAFRSHREKKKAPRDPFRRAKE